MILNKLKLKLLQNLSVNAYGQLITVITQLISVPLYIHFWGVELYGEWIILSAIPTYIALSDVGFASVAANDMTMKIAKSDRLGALSVFQSIWILVSVISFIIAMFSILVIYLIPIKNYLNINIIDIDDIRVILLLLIGYVLIGLQFNIINSAFRAEGKYAFGTFLNNSIRLLEWSFCVIGLIFESSPLVIATIMFLIRLISMAFSLVFFKRKLKFIKFGISKATFKRIKELTKPALAFMAFPLGLSLNLQGVILIIGSQLGPASVVMLTTYRTLTRLLTQLITMINQSVWPEISAAFGIGNVNLVARLHRNFSTITFWVGLIVTFILALFGNCFIDFWTQKSFTKNDELFYLLLIAGFLNVIWQTSWVFLMAINMHQKIAKYFIISNFLGLILIYFLISKVGLISVGLIGILIELPLILYSVKKTINILNDNYKNYFQCIFFISKQ